MVNTLGLDACPVAPFCPLNLPKLCPFMAQTWSLHGPPNCRVGKFGDLKKNQKNMFLLLKSDFFYLNQIFIYFFKYSTLLLKIGQISTEERA